ncbi:integrase catalytic domain-containing protein [Trichonephila clavata]|uniref:Integrase catalytic domain-containing protein n=1 Tax=Trichonephila clavata TaxID=2740835 RepID=A0A8X6H2Q3_TRICU|nr:integrase catalytic domain-containing protein [Trichonephila clavata]
MSSSNLLSDIALGENFPESKKDPERLKSPEIPVPSPQAPNPVAEVLQPMKQTFYKSNDIPKLKKLHCEIEVNVRSLSALGLEPKSYSSMLIAVVLKIIPTEFTLEYNRRNVDKKLSPDINDFLEYFPAEIESRERTYLIKLEFDTTSIYTNSKKNKFKPLNKVQACTSTCEFITSVNERDLQHCFFCNLYHQTEKCNKISIEKKKEILKKQGKCFLCLRPKHCIKNCLSNMTCRIGNGRHNKTISFKSKLIKENKHAESEEKKTDSQDTVISTISYNKQNKIFLQTCTITLEHNSKEIFSRLLCDCGSMRTFITQKLSNCLGLTAIRKEKLSVFSFGNKTPIEKDYDVVKLTLKNKDSPNLKTDIDALVTDQISAVNIPPPELDNIPLI